MPNPYGKKLSDVLDVAERGGNIVWFEYITAGDPSQETVKFLKLFWDLWANLPVWFCKCS